LSPIFPLAGDARIYPEFATGAFAWRVAPFVPAEDRQARDVVSADELESVLDSDPPAAILTGSEETLEEPFILYAQENGYQAIDLPDGMQLWRPAP
jgi:hypothetical protein